MPREIAESASKDASPPIIGGACVVRQNSSPDYVGLVKFLLEPFLDESESLSIDCEHLSTSNKVWLRVAFNTADKGKVFGRGGRNIQAVSTILTTAAMNVNQSLYLDIYNSDRNLASVDPKPQYQKKNRPRRPENNQATL